MNLSIGISPCPNDTYIFDALIHQKIDTKGLTFDVHLEDVQTLNEWAIQEKTDIIKVSYGAYPLLKERYTLLSAGGAMGRGVGPLLVGKRSPKSNDPLLLKDEVAALRVLLPGLNTTAHFLFSFAFPEVATKQFSAFHTIEQALLENTADLGVIIHENRFTYQHKGLYRWADLGEIWEQRTGYPIPLGGILASKRLDSSVIRTLDQLISESLSYARKRDPDLSPFVKQHAQEMNEEVMKKHIALYVNEFSENMGEEGRKAVEAMMKIREQLH